MVRLDFGVDNGHEDGVSLLKTRNHIYCCNCLNDHVQGVDGMDLDFHIGDSGSRLHSRWVSRRNHNATKHQPS